MADHKNFHRGLSFKLWWILQLGAVKVRLFFFFNEKPQREFIWLDNVASNQPRSSSRPGEILKVFRPFDQEASRDLNRFLFRRLLRPLWPRFSVTWWRQFLKKKKEELEMVTGEWKLARLAVHSVQDDDGYHDDQTGQKKQKSTSCADHPSSRAQESHSWPTDLWNWMENINLCRRWQQWRQSIGRRTECVG